MGSAAWLGAAEPAAPAPRWPEIDPALRNEEAFGLKFWIMLDQRPSSVWSFLEDELKRRPDPYVKAYVAWCCFFGPNNGMGPKKDYARGRALAAEAMAAGSLVAQETLGRAIGLGLGGPADAVESARLLRAAANRGSMRALARLGRYEMFGYGVAPNAEAAERDLRRAAELGGILVEYRIIAGAYESGDQGLPRDLNRAVDCYYRIAYYGSRYVEKDFDKLEKLGAPNVRLYRALAMVHDANEGVWVTNARVRREVPVLEELGKDLAAAQYELGTVYIDDDWINHDFSKALEHLNRARGLGEDRANFSLARMRLLGRGAPRDEAGAMSDLQLLAADGDAHAETYLGALYYWGSSGAPKLPKDPHKAYEFTRQGAENGSIIGLVNLARCYEGGIGVPQDYLLAAKLYWVAHNRGYYRGGEYAIRLSHFVELP